MSSLWSRTSAAVNTGYGMRPTPLSGDIDWKKLLESINRGPIAKTKGAGKKTRSRRSRRSYDVYGGEEFWGTLLQSLGASASSAIKQLALETGASITELLANPKELIAKLMTFAPAAAKAVAGFFGKTTKPATTKETPAQKRRRYLAYLKKNDPELYRMKMLQLRKQREQMLMQQLKMLKDQPDDDDLNYGDLNYDGDYKNVSKPAARREIKPPGMI